MEDMEKILLEVIEKLRGEYRPKKVILFGSYAYGKPTEDSDIDLLILKDTDKSRAERFVEVKRILYDPKLRVTISPLVYTPEELEERLEIGDDFVEEILRRGVVVYEEAGS
ncbi:MAG: nucleotidyltransferase domain-containing protein [Candidatus Bathyarchaeia archaeon]